MTLPLLSVLTFFRASPTLAHRPIAADAQAQRVDISRGIRDWPLVTLFYWLIRPDAPANFRC